MKSMSDAFKLKEEIIVHVLEFLEHQKKEDRTAAIEKLEDFAKFYKIPLRRKSSMKDLKKSLYSFILNKQGYLETITSLYNSLT